jgi:DNA primase
MDRVLDIANKYLTGIKRSGNDNILARCPFHVKPDGSMERHPSFSMSLSLGVYHCFACKSSGTLNTFLRSMGVSYVVIGTVYSDLLDEVRENAKAARPLVINATVSNEPISEVLLGILDNNKEKISKELPYAERTLKHFEVGFDEIHRRITFPLRSLDGTLVGISGRTTIDEEPRYKIYDEEYTAFELPPQHNLEKSKLLWNGHNIYPKQLFQSKPQDLIIVEGFKACMSVWEAGFENVIALLGSHLSANQKWVIERMGGRIIVMTDNDMAGMKAKNYIGGILGRSLDVMIADYDAKQPSDLSTSEITKSINAAVNYELWSLNNGIR